MFEFLVDTMSRNSLIKEIISTHIENDVNCDNLSSLTISSKQWVLVVTASVVVFQHWFQKIVLESRLRKYLWFCL